MDAKSRNLTNTIEKNLRVKISNLPVSAHNYSSFKSGINVSWTFDVVRDSVLEYLHRTAPAFTPVASQGRVKEARKKQGIE